MRAGGKVIEVARIRITAAGRDALGNAAGAPAPMNALGQARREARGPNANLWLKVMMVPSTRYHPPQYAAQRRAPRHSLP